VVIRLKVPIEMHYTVIPMRTSKVNSSPICNSGDAASYKSAHMKMVPYVKYNQESKCSVYPVTRQEAADGDEPMAEQRSHNLQQSNDDKANTTCLHIFIET